MTIVPLHDQKKLMVQFESEFNNIVLKDSLSRGSSAPICKARAVELINEIKQLAKPRYFEEETLTFFQELSSNINRYINNFLADSTAKKAA